MINWSARRERNEVARTVYCTDLNVRRQMAERRLPNWKSETSEVFAWSMFNFFLWTLI